MPYFSDWQRIDLQHATNVKPLTGVLFSADSGANLFGAEIYDHGAPASLTGASCIGYAIRADGSTVTVQGSVTDNKAYILLTGSAYSVPGTLDILIKVTVGSGDNMTKTGVAAWRATVVRSSTDTIVDPGHVIPSLEELLAQIAAMEAGTAAANAAATAATTAAGNANTKAGLADTAATRADAAAAALENMDASASTLTPGSDATAQITTVSGHYRALFGIPKGDTGATGPAPQIASTVTTYQESSSGSTIPSGTWLNAIPNPLTQGMFLWTKSVITYDTGDTLTQYSISHQGLDGTGSVNSVDGVSPDASGNVALTANDIPISAQDSTKIAAAIGGKADKVSGAVNGNLAGLDANGNLTDSGSKASDFLTQHQDISGKLDASAMGIVEDGDTATHTIAQGQYVIWQGALYTADAAIASGTTLAASGGNKNLTVAPNGGLNALNDNLTKLNSNLGKLNIWIGTIPFVFNNSDNASVVLSNYDGGISADRIVGCSCIPMGYSKATFGLDSNKYSLIMQAHQAYSLTLNVMVTVFYS